MRDFIAYKCTHSAIVLGGPSDTNLGRNLISIDNRWGIAVHGGNNGNAELDGVTIYGSNDVNQDCPPNSKCDHCFDTTGIVLNQACQGSHLDSQVKHFKHPLFKACNSGMYGKAEYRNVVVKDFTSNKKSCGAKQVVFAPWKKQMDYIGFAEFFAPTFENVDTDALTHISPPD